MAKIEIKPIKSAIHKKKEKKIKPKAIKAETFKQELFCQGWVDSKGNGTASALIAFDIKGKEILGMKMPETHTEITVGKEGKERKKMIINPEYKIWKDEIKRIESVASSIATEYLRKPEIIDRIDEILEEREFNDKGVKREHFKLIKRADDNVKVRAIDMYYKLKQKYSDTTINISIEDAMEQNIKRREEMLKENEKE